MQLVVLVLAVLLPVSCALRRGRHLQTVPSFENGEVMRSRFAVVRPFWRGELSRISSAIASEALPAPCRNSSLPVDLVLYYAGSPSDMTVSHNSSAGPSSVANMLHALSEEPVTRKCFQNVRIEYARVMPGISYPAAPCLQFTSIFNTKPKPAWGYEAFFQMELDVKPLREGWLEDMLPLFERTASGDAWVIGGFYDTACLLDSQGQTPALPQGLPANDPRVDRHPNGNAVYSTTLAYIKQVENQQKKCRFGGLSSHYDFRMFEDWREHRHPQQLAGKWAIDSYFKNCKPTPAERALGVSTMPPQEIASQFPQALLAHCHLE